MNDTSSSKFKWPKVNCFELLNHVHHPGSWSFDASHLAASHNPKHKIRRLLLDADNSTNDQSCFLPDEVSPASLGNATSFQELSTLQLPDRSHHAKKRERCHPVLEQPPPHLPPSLPHTSLSSKAFNILSPTRSPLHHAPLVVPSATKGAQCSPANQIPLSGIPSLILSICFPPSSSPI